ncbi:MAG: hypothetical protein LBP31_02825 [Holosporales bacterium]|jgi:hypothetical protein|nr:hypothetical protein [Holosporales bacterium]
MIEIYTQLVYKVTVKVFKLSPESDLLANVESLAPERIVDIVFEKVGKECLNLTKMPENRLKDTFMFIARQELALLLNDKEKERLYRKALFDLIKNPSK